MARIAGLSLAERCWKEPFARRTMEPDTVRERYVTLSTRQRTILLLRCQGRTNDEVARQLFVQEKTVKNHMTRILAQMGLRGRCGSTALCSQINAVTRKSR